MAQFLIVNGGSVTTSALPKVTTGAGTLKSLLQVKLKSGVAGVVREWGVSFDGSSAATPGSVELAEVNVAATVTAYAAADIHQLDAAALMISDPTTAFFEVGTSASGYTASAEGSITALRYLDPPQLIAPTGQYVKQLPLGVNSLIQSGKFLRIRTNFAAAISAFAYVIIEI